ncbi:MAG: hypothetical protein FD169_631 [Bacillota bacterium]|nr:MAG: hypothetical protein FD169_631 [Bacillota bacterium]
MAVSIPVRRILSFYKKRDTKEYHGQYLCKSRAFRASFIKCTFRHVNFKGSIMTSCSFKDSSFIGCDFWGTNFRRSSFRNARFRNCVFVGTLLNGCNFGGATFDNCTFVNTNLNAAKGISISNTVSLLYSYPSPIVSDQLARVLAELSALPYLLRYRLLHLSTQKYNMLNLALLLSAHSEGFLIEQLPRLSWGAKTCTFGAILDKLGRIRQV